MELSAQQTGKQISRPTGCLFGTGGAGDEGPKTGADLVLIVIRRVLGFDQTRGSFKKGHTKSGFAIKTQRPASGGTHAVAR